MQTVNRNLLEPKHNCWACKGGECQILTETHCRRSQKCGHFKTQEQYDADLRKANARLKSLGVLAIEKYVKKYKSVQKNNRVSGN